MFVKEYNFSVSWQHMIDIISSSHYYIVLQFRKHKNFLTA